jgi:hypothetical protein
VIFPDVHLTSTWLKDGATKLECYSRCNSASTTGYPLPELSSAASEISHKALERHAARGDPLAAASMDVSCSDILAITPSRSWIKAANGLFRAAFSIPAHQNVIWIAAAIIDRWE